MESVNTTNISVELPTKSPINVINDVSSNTSKESNHRDSALLKELMDKSDLEKAKKRM